MTARRFPFGHAPVDLAPDVIARPEHRAEQTAPLAERSARAPALPFKTPPPDVRTQPVPVGPPAAKLAPIPSGVTFRTVAALLLLVLDLVAIVVAAWAR